MLVPPPPLGTSQLPLATSEGKLLRVLLVEDRAADAALLLHLLRESGFAPEWRRVETESEYLASLNPDLDIILADYSLPQFSGLEALQLLRERGLSIPFILVTGTAGEEAAVSALQAGADDYLLKDRLGRLGRAVNRALEQRVLGLGKERAERVLRETEQRLLNQERAARAEAEASVRMRDEFVGIASHELRTPLTAIKCSVQLLLSRLDRGHVDTSQVVDKLRTVNAMSDRLTLLIADLLDVTRLRTGQLELRPETLDVAGLVGQVVDEQRAQLPSHSQLTLRVVGRLPLVSADPYRLQQVVTNVLQNAIKYSPAHGEVQVSMRVEGAGLLITVSDNGIGLPPEAIESIFEPFGRAHNAQQHQLPGMGLGLYITRQIVEQHGGRVWAASAGEGAGTLFSIWLPTASDVGPEAIPSSDPEPAAALARSRVLVVDDQAAICDTLTAAFELEGYECRPAGNGKEALTLMSTWRPDLIVLDLMMPVMDGWSFRREQRARPMFCDIPVVVVSACSARDVRDSELVPAAVLPKPFDLTQLVDMVHEILAVTPPHDSFALVNG